MGIENGEDSKGPKKGEIIQFPSETLAFLDDASALLSKQNQRLEILLPFLQDILEKAIHEQDMDAMTDAEAAVASGTALMRRCTELQNLTKKIQSNKLDQELLERGKQAYAELEAAAVEFEALAGEATNHVRGTPE